MKLIKEGHTIQLDAFDVDEIFNYVAKKDKFDNEYIKEKSLDIYQERLHFILMDLGITPNPSHIKKLLKSTIILPELKEDKKDYKYKFNNFDQLFEYIKSKADDSNFFPYRAK